MRATVTQLVERHPSKVEVASSSLVRRSKSRYYLDRNLNKNIMKKILMFAVALIALCSCGNSSKCSEGCSEVCQADTVVVDSLAVDSVEIAE